MAINKIQKKIVIPFALLVIVFFIVTTYVVVRILENSLEQGFIEVTGDHLFYASEYIKRDGMFLLNYAQFLADNPKISEHLSHKLVLSQEAMPVMNKFGLDYISFVNTQGKKILTLYYDKLHVIHSEPTAESSEEKQLTRWGLVGINTFLFVNQRGNIMMMGVAPTKVKQGINGAVLVGKYLDAFYFEGLKDIMMADIGIYGPQAQIFAGTYQEDKNRCAGCHAADWSVQNIAQDFHTRINLLGKSFFLSSVMGGYRYGYMALEIEGNKVAMIGIRNSYQALTDAKRKIYLFAALAFFASMGLLIGVTDRLARRFTDPLLTLTAATKKLAEGDLEQQVTIKTGDEVEILAESFNYMAAQLKSWQQAHAEKERMLQKYHQEQMERAAHLATMGELAAGIAHEIKNPLAGIMGAMQILEEDFDPQNPHREIVNEVQQQLQRLNKTVVDLLSFARPALPEFALAQVNDVLERVFFLVEQQPAAKKVQLVKKLTAQLPLIFLDAKQMQQVFLNIIINALQAMPEGGELTVESFYEEKSHALGVRVTDTGSGIPLHILSDVFKPFYTTKHKGTGLGLSITKGIVERHNGEIFIDSHVGHGTVVSVYLPVEEKLSKTSSSQDTGPQS
jgi:signal transduction histidine kinase